jgi:hypothetical protein
MNVIIALTMMTVYLLANAKPADIATALLIGALSFCWCKFVDYRHAARQRF